MESARGYDRWYAARRVGWGWGAAAAYGAQGGVGTAFSAQENARANTIRAQGEYNQMQAAAMVDYETARSQYIENQKQWTQVYMERQRAAAELNMKNQEEAQARAELIKAFNAANPPAGPARLTSTQLNPSTGAINWPAGLAGAAFDGPRKAVETQFALRSHTDTHSGIAADVEKSVNEMRSTLRAKIREIPTQDYLEARRFLDSLVAESRLAVH